MHIIVCIILIEKKSLELPNMRLTFDLPYHRVFMERFTIHEIHKADHSDIEKKISYVYCNIHT